jgi:hypothetical protein
MIHRKPPNDTATWSASLRSRLWAASRAGPGVRCLPHAADRRMIGVREPANGESRLKYPDWYFDTIISGRFNSQNRLRESDFIELLESSGVGLLWKESVIHEEDLERMRSFKVAKRFRGKSLEDLATARSTLIGRKDAPSVKTPVP